LTPSPLLSLRERREDRLTLQSRRGKLIKLEGNL
jgi:hypothetical protein